jgi:hypothetical protein
MPPTPRDFSLRGLADRFARFLRSGGVRDLDDDLDDLDDAARFAAAAPVPSRRVSAGPATLGDLVRFWEASGRPRDAATFHAMLAMPAGVTPPESAVHFAAPPSESVELRAARAAAAHFAARLAGYEAREREAAAESARQARTRALLAHTEAGRDAIAAMPPAPVAMEPARFSALMNATPEGQAILAARRTP